MIFKRFTNKSKESVENINIDVSNINNVDCKMIALASQIEDGLQEAINKIANSIPEAYKHATLYRELSDEKITEILKDIVSNIFNYDKLIDLKINYDRSNPDKLNDLNCQFAIHKNFDKIELYNLKLELPYPVFLGLKQNQEYDMEMER